MTEELAALVAKVVGKAEASANAWARYMSTDDIGDRSALMIALMEQHMAVAKLEEFMKTQGGE